MQYHIRNGDRVIGNVGNRNLAVRTGREYVMGYGIPNTIWKDGYAYSSLPTTGNAGEILPQDYPYSFWYNLEPGQKYTQTIWLETDATIIDLRKAKITWYNDTTGHDFRPATIVELAHDSYKLVSTYVWPNKEDNRVRLFDIGGIRDAFDLSKGTYLKFGKLKLENGGTSTDWSPAPEDYGITDRNNAYRVTGLAPSTTYQLSVAPFNGLREGPKESITVRTRGLRVTVPVSLNPGAAVTLHYQEYSIGLVPLGTEPTGMFGGGNRQDVPAKVISSSDGSSVLEITSNFNLMNDNMTMNKITDKSFAAFQGYKALYFNEG